MPGVGMLAPPEVLDQQPGLVTLSPRPCWWWGSGSWGSTPDMSIMSMLMALPAAAATASAREKPAPP